MDKTTKTERLQNYAQKVIGHSMTMSDSSGNSYEGICVDVILHKGKRLLGADSTEYEMITFVLVQDDGVMAHILRITSDMENLLYPRQVLDLTAININ